MSAPAISFLILIVIAVAIFFVWLIYSRRYQRASQETAFVRTGYGGQKVVQNGGALVFPVLHEVIPVNMNTMRLDVARSNNQALVTKDRMRMDVQAEFYVRVKPDSENIAMAAQTLGRRTTNVDSLKSLVEGKFVNALRAVAAEMNMDELHQNRVEFVRRVQEAVGDGLSKNGLELESVSLSELDQTDRKYFNPQNAFDAEGLMLLTELIQTRSKQRNVIERDTEVAIRQKDLDAERKKMDIAKEEEFARLEQEREIQVRRSEQKTSIISQQVEKEREAKEAELEARKRIEQAQIDADREIEEKKITKNQVLKEIEFSSRKAVELAETAQDREIREARIKADKEIESARLLTEQALDEERIRKDQYVALKEIEREKQVNELKIFTDLFLQEKEIEKQREIEAAEVKKRSTIKEADILSRREIDKLQLQYEREIEEERITKDDLIQAKEIEHKRTMEELEVEADRLISEIRIAAEQKVRQVRQVSEKTIQSEEHKNEQFIKDLEINKLRAIGLAEIESRKTIGLAELAHRIALAEKEREETLAQAEVDRSKAVAVEAEEKLITLRQIETAQRQKDVELLEARKIVEREVINIVETAKAKLEAANCQAETVEIIAGGESRKIKILAEAHTEAELLRTQADEKRYHTEADGKKALNQAENLLDSDKSQARIKTAIIEHMAEIIRESVKPMEAIEGIKILQVEGLSGGTGAYHGAPRALPDSPNGGGNLADQLVNSALRYRGQAPLVDAILKEIGISGGDINGLSTPLKDRSDEEPDEEEDDGTQ